MVTCGLRSKMLRTVDTVDGFCSVILMDERLLQHEWQLRQKASMWPHLLFAMPCRQEWFTNVHHGFGFTFISSIILNHIYILKGCRPCRRPLTEETAKLGADGRNSGLVTDDKFRGYSNPFVFGTRMRKGRTPAGFVPKPLRNRSRKNAETSLLEPTKKKEV